MVSMCRGDATCNMYSFAADDHHREMTIGCQDKGDRPATVSVGT